MSRVSTFITRASIGLLTCPVFSARAETLVSEESMETVQFNADLIWTLMAGTLVFFMQVGFALLELGFVRSKNVINTLMKILVGFCLVSVIYLLVGFPLMFGKSLGGLVGMSDFDLLQRGPTDSSFVYFFFQVMFCAAATAIVSGSVAERIRFMPYTIFSAAMAMLIYPVFGHWAWGNGLHLFMGGSPEAPSTQGWLQTLGFRDFAGGAVVHAIGGAAALAGAIVLGPRLNRFGIKRQAMLVAGHNLPLAALGTMILWFGWFGFNAGSTVKAGAEIGRIAVNSNISGAVAALGAMFSMWKIQGRPDLGITLNGALAGLVAATPCCAVVSTQSILFVGLVAGLLTTYSTLWLEKWQIDDAIGAVPVHLANGIWGCLALAVFDSEGFIPQNLGIQCLGVGIACLYSFILSYIIFKLISRFMRLRANDVEQDEGLDFHEHAASAYPEFQTLDR